MNTKLFPLLPLLVLPLIGGAAPAQAPGAHWSITNVTGSAPPPSRENPGVSDLSGMLVFGGTDMATGQRRNDLWRFDGTAWTQLSANGDPTAPPARAQCAVAYDVARGRLVVFGGHDGSAALNDTWEWNGTQWSNVTPASGSPSARRFCAMAYDWVNNKLLMFGGNDGAYKADSWHWDGTTWTQLQPATMVPARQQHGMVDRIDRSDIVMCCGQDSSTKFGDTWLWNGADWRQVVTATLPQPRVALDVTYDQARQRVIIPGGNNANGNPIGAIAEFDGSDWINRPLDPVLRKRTRYFVAFVPALGKSYLFGGQQPSNPPPTATYEYQTDFVASYSRSGTGCAGAAGTPTLSFAGAPWLNTTSSLVVGGAGASDLVFLMLGFDNTNWRGNPLPMNAGPLGAPGCSLYLAPLEFAFLGVGAGATPLDVFVNDNSALLGLVFFAQGIVLGPAGAIGATELGTGVIGIL